MDKFTCALVVALSCVAAEGQRDFSKAEITVAAVAGSVYMLQGPGGNIGVQTGADGFVLIDNKFAPLADKILVAMKQVGEGDLLYVLNTHYHGDHTGGNALFGAQIPIIAHHNVRRRLADKPQQAWPIITFEQGLSLHLNGEEVEFLHFPHAHTDGDGAVFFSVSNVVHMGDLFFQGRFPYVDIDAGGSVQGVIAAGETVLGRIDEGTRIIPGHGAVVGPDDLRLYLRMLQESMQAVGQAVAAGQDLETIDLGTDWADWGGGFISTERWVATVARSLELGD
ncbi:MAG: MBL fold metallo-hydrolase [Candidatus Latescibacteria bacterium]|nr:MBL fold metallo-hydrolase [Candidatus Latescibacterota bacterium]